MNILLIFLLSMVSGVFYRLGGSSKGNTLFRDLGVSLVVSGSLVLLFGIHNLKELVLLHLSVGLSWVALSTYRYFLPKPKNYLWYHYALHGFFVALAIFPWAIATHHLIGMAARCVICAILVGVWSEFNKNAFIEEFGRGFIIVATLLLLSI